MKQSLTLLLLASLCCHANADGVIRDALGARTAGRGGTNIAFADAGMILHDNPAGMINLPGTWHAEFGVDVLITDVVYSDPDDRGASAPNPIPLGNVAIIRKSANQCWAYGIGFFTPGGFATEYDLNGPAPFLGKQKYKSFGSLGRVLPAVALQVSDRLSVGGTLGVAISHTELEGPYFVQSAPFTGTPTIMDIQGTGAALTWSLGFQYVVSDRTTIGMNYQSESRFHLDGNTTTTIPVLGGSSAFDTTLDMTWPRALGLGVRHELTPCCVGSVDVIWYNWSNAFDHAGLHLSNPSNPAFAVLSGFTEQLPLLWRDSISVRLGMERYFSPTRLIRCGYEYHRNPIPAATLTPYLPTTVEHTLALGVGWRHAGWETDLAYQFMFGPTNEVGNSGLAGGDFNQSRLRVQAHFVFVGFTKRY